MRSPITLLGRQRADGAGVSRRAGRLMESSDIEVTADESSSPASICSEGRRRRKEQSPVGDGQILAGGGLSRDRLRTGHFSCWDAQGWHGARIYYESRTCTQPDRHS